MSLLPSLTVGTNTYVTLAEAKAYVADERLSIFTPAATIWDDMSDPDKQFALLQAMKHLAQIPVLGTLTESDQALPFPRTHKASDFTVEAETDTVPYLVKIAQVEEAISIGDRQNWTSERLVKHEVVNGQEQKDNPDVVLFSTIAHRLMLESGWMAQYNMEIDN